mgnify:CR=1 FL=1
MLSDEQLNLIPENKNALVDIYMLKDYIDKFESLVEKAKEKAIDDVSRERLNRNEAELRRLKSIHKSFINLLWHHNRVISMIVEEDEERINQEIKSLYDKND